MISSTDDPSACSHTAPVFCHSMIRFRLCNVSLLSCLVRLLLNLFRELHIEIPWPELDRSDEGPSIPADEFLDCHRLVAADFSDIVVRAGKDALAVVDGGFAQVLHQEGFWRAAGKWTRIAIHGHRGVLSGPLRAAADDFKELLDRNLLVPDLLPDHATDYRRDLWMGELYRTEKRVGPSDMRCRVLEYQDNKASLVCGRDR